MNAAAHANKLDLSRKNYRLFQLNLKNHLEELWLDDNQIRQLPEEIQYVSTLKKFSIYNQLDSLEFFVE